MSSTGAVRRAHVDGKDDGEMGGDVRRHPGTAAVTSIPSASSACAETEQQAAVTESRVEAVVDESNVRNRDPSSSQAVTRRGSRPTSGVYSFSTDIAATPVPADLDQWKEPTPRADNHRGTLSLPTGADLKGGGDRHGDWPGDRSDKHSAGRSAERSVDHSADRSFDPSGDRSAQRTENRSETRVADRSAEDYSECQPLKISVPHRDKDSDRGSYGDIGLKGGGRRNLRGEQAIGIRRSEIGRGYGEQGSHACRKSLARSPERAAKANRKGPQATRRYSRDERVDDDKIEIRHHQSSPRNEGNTAAVGGRGDALVHHEHAKNSHGWPSGGAQRHYHRDASRVFDGRRGGGQIDDRRGQRQLGEGGHYFPDYDGYDEDNHRSSFREEAGKYCKRGMAVGKGQLFA